MTPSKVHKISHSFDQFSIKTDKNENSIVFVTYPTETAQSDSGINAKDALTYLYQVRRI